MDDTFDLVVIGGGPAGSCAAYTAARLGLSVAIVDKKEFPREKLCGGLLTGRSRDTFKTIFGHAWDEELVFTSDSIAFFMNGEELCEQNAYTSLSFTNRFEFDNYLLDLAFQKGAKLFLGNKVKKLLMEENRVELSDGRNLKFKYLVAADGVNSFIARTIFGKAFNPKKIGFGLEVEVPRDHYSGYSDNVQIDFGAAAWGYGWTFPKRNTVTIGIGGIHKYNPNLKAQFKQYLSKKNLDINNYKVKGHHIPFGEYKKTPTYKNIVFCGDAAGYVDAITGEGIAHAMQSGHCSALAIHKTIGADNPDLLASLYQRKVKNISSSIQSASLLRYLIFPSFIQKIFKWAFSDARTLQKAYLDLLEGKHEYSDLCFIFLIQVLKALKKVFLYPIKKILRRAK